MSKDELLVKLKALHGDDLDSEAAHIEADEWLLEYINDAEISEAYNEIEKWYA